MVRVKKWQLQPTGELTSDSGFARAWEADEGDDATGCMALAHLEQMAKNLYCCA